MRRPKFLKQNIFGIGLLAGIVLITLALKWESVIKKTVSENFVSSAVLKADHDYLEIPQLKISSPIIYSNASKESEIQKSLVQGVVHLAKTALPGEAGNAYIIGHSSNYPNAPGEYNEIFKDLPKIAVGDQILVYRGNQKLNFVVYQTRIVEPTELWVMSQATNGLAVLTLQTSYPVGSSKQRFVAMARLDLENKTPK